MTSRMTWSTSRCSGYQSRASRARTTLSSQQFLTLPSGLLCSVSSWVTCSPFSCAAKLGDRNYADVEAFCQVYHTCVPREDLSNVKFSRLCPNGTIFDQRGQTCRWWYLVDCDTAEQFYNVQQDNTVEQTQDYDYQFSYDYDYDSSSSSSSSFSSDLPDTFLFAIPQGLLNENILNNVFKFPLPSNTNIFNTTSVSSSSSSSSIRPRPRPRPRTRTQTRSRQGQGQGNRNRTRIQDNSPQRSRNNNNGGQRTINSNNSGLGTRNSNSSQQRTGNSNNSQQRTGTRGNQQRTSNNSQERNANQQGNRSNNERWVVLSCIKIFSTDKCSDWVSSLKLYQSQEQTVEDEPLSKMAKYFSKIDLKYTRASKKHQFKLSRETAKLSWTCLDKSKIYNIQSSMYI